MRWSDTIKWLVKRLTFEIFLTASYYFLLLDNYWGLGFFVVQVLFSFAFLFSYKKPENQKEVMFYLGSATLLTVFLALRASDFVRFLTAVAVIALNMIVTVRVNRESLLTIKTIIFAPQGVLLHTFRNLGDYLLSLFGFLGRVSLKKQVTKERSGGLILGSFLAVALALVFLSLFASADPIFGRYVNDFLDSFPAFKINSDLFRTWAQLLIVFGLFSSLLSQFNFKQDEFSLNIANAFKLPVTIATTAVSFVTALFLAVQAQYLFAGTELLAQLNISYSEYTRRGFFQLVVVSAISLVLLWFLIRKPKEERNSGFVRFLSFAFLGEVFLVLSSAFYRVYLYQAVHGFTQVRLVGMVFALWLLGVLLIFIFNLTDKLKSGLMPFAGVINTVLAIFILNFINIDHLVGAVKQPNLGYRIDHPYIVRLSEDAWIGWRKTLDFYEENCPSDSWAIMFGLEERHGSFLRERDKLRLRHKLQGKKLKTLGAWNLPKQQAFEFLDKNLERIIKVKSCYIVKPLSPTL